ncbi:transposase [Cellulomonas denverensis]|uniref:Transposase n=1 Tax=Cellulomonas denverensis TaxID=264297 RepID=A0A7X6KYS2_9CELL|nr:transposase [Cellulomonas denverensis]
MDAMLYVSHTGCQWRFMPESFGPWTRVWSQFRRWSRNGTWERVLTVLHSRCSAPSATPGASRSPTAASDAPADWRSRSRTPPSRQPAGSRSPASRPPCAICREHLLIGAH